MNVSMLPTSTVSSSQRVAWSSRRSPTVLFGYSVSRSPPSGTAGQQTCRAETPLDSGSSASRRSGRTLDGDRGMRILRLANRRELT